MFHAVIDHTPNSDAVRKGQGGDKEREGGWKEGKRRGRGLKEGREKGKQKARMQYLHTCTCTCTERGKVSCVRCSWALVPCL